MIRLATGILLVVLGLTGCGPSLREREEARQQVKRAQELTQQILDQVERREFGEGLTPLAELQDIYRSTRIEDRDIPVDGRNVIDHAAGCLDRIRQQVQEDLPGLHDAFLQGEINAAVFDTFCRQLRLPDWAATKAAWDAEADGIQPAISPEP